MMGPVAGVSFGNLARRCESKRCSLDPRTVDDRRLHLRGMYLERRAAVRFALVFLLVACRPPGYGKGDDVGPDPEVDAPVAGDDAPAEPDGPISGATCNKEFRLDGHSTAATVWMSGSFVAWGGDPPHGALELAKGVDGAWTITHDFEPGSHQYKFIIDGTNWITDPTNPDVVTDGSGNTNSLYLCAP